MRNIVSRTTACIAVIVMTAQAQNMKFPQAKTFAGMTKPSHSQAKLNDDVIKAYEEYKANHLKQAKSTNGGYYIYSKDTHEGWNVVTVSEAHGWGMVIMTLMAGYDSKAKEYFDGMVTFYNNYRATGRGSNLMSWRVEGTVDVSENTSKKDGSALDGDMDIAYALLMAHKQWGDAKYKTQAIEILKDIYSNEINPDTKTLQLGNFVPNNITEASDKYSYTSVAKSKYYHTRPSDWMGGHLRTYADAIGDGKWDEVADKIYEVYNGFIANSSNQAGTSKLISDFVYHEQSGTWAVEPNFLEGPNDGFYATNASRVPWRVAADFAHFQSVNSKAMLQNFSSFIINASGGDPKKIYPGYYLNGLPLTTTYTSPAFTAPFVAASMVSGNQDFVTKGWDYLQNSYMAGDDAFQRAIRLQCMLLISGNWWSYNDAPTIDNGNSFDTSGIYFDDFADSYVSQSKVSTEYGKEKFPTDTTGKASGWWYVYDAGTTGSVQNGAGTTTITDKNGEEMFNKESRALDVKLNKTGCVAVGFPEDKYFDLSAMTGFTIKAKGTRKIRVTFNTDDSGTPSKDSFWGGFGYDITLGDAVQEYQILADLLVPAAYSEEQTKSLTWKNFGAPKVKGITISMADEASSGSVVLSSIKLNGKDIKNETFGYTSPVIIGPVDGVNVLSYGDWGTSADTLGSKGTLDFAKNGDSITTVTATIDRKAFSKPDAYDTYVSLYGSYDGDFKNLKAVEVTYSADKAFRLALPITGKTDEDGTAHFITLPATGSETKTISKALSDFAQPSWCEKDKTTAMDLSLVSGVTLEIDSDAATALAGKIAISSLKFDGAAINKPTSIFGIEFGRSNTVGFSSIRQETGMVHARLTLPRASNTNLTVVNMQGRVVANVNQSLTAGMNMVSLDISNQGSGVYFLVAEGLGGVYRHKLVLK